MRAVPYDVVIVGGGSAGSVLAARLSEDQDRRVLLLEAGMAPRSLEEYPEEARDGTTVAASVPGSRIGWTYRALLTDRHAAASVHMPQREYDLVRGRILGGSGAINGGYFIRPRPADHALWAARGGERWAANETLPLLRAMETDLDHGETGAHGGTGPIPVRRAGRDPVSHAFASAATAAGFPLDPDKNAASPGGVGPVPQNVVDGVRLGPGTQYLLPAMGRPNLTVRGGAVVTRIVFEAGRAIGVEVRGDDEVVLAGEVLLSAGAIETPALLMRSGIGPADELRGHGIRVVADLPVGRALSDHPSITLAFRLEDDGLAVDDAGSPFPTALHLSAPTGEPLELLLGVRPLDDILPGLGAPHALPLMVDLPATGAGTLSLRSADPATPPRIAYGYLATRRDRALARHGVRTAVALLRSRDFSRVSSGDDGPGPTTLADDDALDTWVMARLGTAVHTCATAPMGQVTDGSGRVHEVAGLRVADTSLLPAAPSRGPAASAVLVGEVVARTVLDGD